MKLQTELYLDQKRRWPTTGRHILAQFDDDTIVVYQAYRPAIGRFAAEHGFFGGDFSFQRMSWLKPNFLWMMFRSSWGTKENQETTLAIWLRRPAFDAILQEAVHSTFVLGLYAAENDWKAAVANSNVRLQWDPDHNPSGGKEDRRAIQLGLRGDALARFGREWITRIEDISEFVTAQREHANSSAHDKLLIPREEVYPVSDLTAARLGIDSWPPLTAGK
ncbi:MAG TPA: DUF4291 domain-containing protein, partial [Gemmataceae bacterium]|nr:DUF4291 domain-containing protein [Gemmataceae bacterium]